MWFSKNVGTSRNPTVNFNIFDCTLTKRSDGVKGVNPSPLKKPRHAWRTPLYEHKGG